MSNMVDGVPSMVTLMFFTEIDMMSSPLVVKNGSIDSAHPDDLRTDSDGGVHQPTVAVVEIVSEVDAIGVEKFHALVTSLVVLCKDNKSEDARFHFGFVEHPLVKEEVVVARCGHDEGNGAPRRPRHRLPCVIDRLVEFVRALHNSVGAPTTFEFSLYGHVGNE